MKKKKTVRTRASHYIGPETDPTKEVYRQLRKNEKRKEAQSKHLQGVTKDGKLMTTERVSSLSEGGKCKLLSRIGGAENIEQPWEKPRRRDSFQ